MVEGLLSTGRTPSSLNYHQHPTSFTQEDLGSHWTSQHCSSAPPPCIDLYLLEEDSPKKSLWAHLRGDSSESYDGSYLGSEEDMETSEITLCCSATSVNIGEDYDSSCSATSVNIGENYDRKEQEVEINLESGIVTILNSSKENSSIENVTHEEASSKAEPREERKVVSKEEHDVKSKEEYKVDNNEEHKVESKEEHKVESTEDHATERLVALLKTEEKSFRLNNEREGDFSNCSTATVKVDREEPPTCSAG